MKKICSKNEDFFFILRQCVIRHIWGTNSKKSVKPKRTFRARESLTSSKEKQLLAIPLPQIPTADR